MALRRMAGLEGRRLWVAVEVPASQAWLALSGYVILILAARNTSPAAFVALGSFYLVLNTFGRGVFVAIELETTRAMSAALGGGRDSSTTLSDSLRRCIVLVGLSLVLCVLFSPLLRGVGGAAVTIALLCGGAVAMALSYLVRAPLAAHRRFHSYSSTWFLEGSIGIGTALCWVVLGVQEPAAWAVLFVAAPFLAAAVTAVSLLRGRVMSRARHHLIRAWADRSPAGAHAPTESGLAMLLWLVLLFLGSQGVWNLAPVYVTGRLGEAGALAAAGFVSAGIVLRAPVFLLPAAQAILVPSVSSAAARGDRAAVERAFRPVVTLLVAAGTVWLLAAVTVVPWLCSTLFGVAVVPGRLTLAALALSALLGAAALIPQTKLVAYARHRSAAAGWLVGLLVVVLVAGLGQPPVAAAAGGQLVASATVMALLWWLDRRTRGQAGPRPHRGDVQGREARTFVTDTPSQHAR